MSRNGYEYSLIGKKRITIIKNGITYFILNLLPVIDGRQMRFDTLSIDSSIGKYVLMSEKHPYQAVIQVINNQISYYIAGIKGYIKELVYFHNSYANLSLLRNFTADYQNYQTGWEKCYVETKSYISPIAEERNNKIRTWGLTPQPRVLAGKLHYLTEEENSWFGFSLPGALPVHSTIFKQNGSRTIKMIFNGYHPATPDDQPPCIYFFDHLQRSYDILEKHYEISKALHYTIDPPFYSWWNKPILSPNSDIAEYYKLGQNGVYRFDLEHDSFVKYITKIEEMTDSTDFTVLIDGYWYANTGNYFSISSIFKDKETLRQVIDELHRRGHRVLLWLSLFKIEGELPPGITPDMTLQQDIFRMFDHTCPVVRDYFRDVIRFMLSANEGCLNGDGIKLDYSYLSPDTSRPFLYDQGWGVGDQLRSKVNAYIYEWAHSIKEDAFISDTCIEPSVPLDVIRLNDEWGEDVNIWLERAAKAVKIRNKLIDTDGFWMHAEKFKNYCMLAPVIGIPSFHCSEKFFSFEALSETDYRRLNSSWYVYNHAPVTPDMQLVVRPKDQMYYRKYTTGSLSGFYSAISINGQCLVTYTREKALIASVSSTTVEIPLPPGLKVKQVIAKAWSNQVANHPYYEGFAKDTVLIPVDDAGREYRWIEVEFI
ncbi:hypothetical protein [Paenibacillus piscarius]|uniref:hypothetical protein n=1 Tax=Paenibacillus piscarius TaxID=1089681 RepID=UPI001EE958AD|nr:hypothetical protein [Paenibacillus piscarius]